LRPRPASGGTVAVQPAGHTHYVITINGSSLTCADVAAAARRTDEVAVSPQAAAAARAAWLTARDLTARQPVYGRNTGVGANHAVAIGGRDRAEHGLRLLRSHAAGAGPLAPPETARALLVVRLNQLGRGGSGVDPAVLPVLADAINRGFVPPVPLYGAIGTGDLTALASAGLCLLGERPWLDGTGTPPGFPLHPDEALAFISSNAATLGDAAISCHDLDALLKAAIVIAAMSLLATHGSLEPYAGPVHAGRPHPGQQRAAAGLRELLTGEDITPARVQDPYGYRAFPQVHGPALDYRDHAERVITTDLNAAAENPLIDAAGHAAWHNGNFHAAYAGLALDALRAALFQTAALSAARHAGRAALHRPERVPGREPGQLGRTDTRVRGAGRGRGHPPVRHPSGARQRGAVARRGGTRGLLHPVRPRHRRRGQRLPGHARVRTGGGGPRAAAGPPGARCLSTAAPGV
jgi:histidine ammonia-lyase